MDQVFPFKPRPFKVPINPLMDGFQTGLDIVGLAPGLGEIADGINGGISLLRGDYVDAGLSFASMIPFAGWAASIGKLGKKALKYGDEVLAAAKHVDEVGELLGRGKATNPPIKGSLSNIDARKWYLNSESSIPELIDTNKPLEQQARQAFDLRNQFRTQAREAMSNKTAADNLYKTDPNMTWDQVISKYINKGFSGDDLWQEIINASTRSRISINKGFDLD